MTLLSLLSLSLVLFSFSSKNITLTQAQCLPDQHQALIQLKEGFKTTELHSWNTSTDCCIWDGITCDEKTGMVTMLNLYDKSILGKINPALFNLSSLQYLNLAFNYFFSPLPQTGFERLANLTHLDLSSNPLHLHNTSLRTLLSNLTKLHVLRLDGVDISLNGSEWSKAVFQVGPTLQVLSMADCGLRGNFPDEIFHLTNLTDLDLSQNSMLSGQLPEFKKQSFLQYFSLSGTKFTGPLPYSIGNLQYLSELGLSDCNFYGEIPFSITNLTRLKYLDLGLNRLTGMIPMSLFSHPSLKSLYLSDNQFSGYLPELSNGSTILEFISLEDNNLQGQLSISRFIKHNKNLESLFLSNNKLSIIEGENNNESFYASFPQLEYLGLASCNLVDFPTFLSYQKNIYSLDLSHNIITGDIPVSICNVTLPHVLDLSYNNLTGTVPSCLLEDTELEVLNLKKNKLSRPLPQNISQACGLKTINLNDNVINGSFPQLLKYCNSLEVLDMGNNRIVNRFPYWLGNLENLRVLVLRSNMFYGKITDLEIITKGNGSFFPMLKVLDLSSNHFSGKLPKNILVNLKTMMGISNTSSRRASYGLSYYKGMNVTYPKAFVTITYKGFNYELKYPFDIFNYIDLSNNRFSGEIPEEIGQLKLLSALNLTHNALVGRIPLELASLHQLESLDLSYNQLSGPIPQELTSLYFLESLNLSYNNLVGEIPEGPEFSSFSNDSYLGNPGLCGSPLSMQCATAPNNEFNEGFPDKGLPSDYSTSTDIIEFSVSICVGLYLGFTFVIWALVYWENGRKWFILVTDKFYFRHFQ